MPKNYQRVLKPGLPFISACVLLGTATWSTWQWQLIQETLGWLVNEMKKINPPTLQIHFSCSESHCIFLKLIPKYTVSAFNFNSDPNQVPPSPSSPALFRIQMLSFTFIMLIQISKQVSLWFHPRSLSGLEGTAYSYYKDTYYSCLNPF